MLVQAFISCLDGCSLGYWSSWISLLPEWTTLSQRACYKVYLMMPCLLFYSLLTPTRIFNFSWLNEFDLQQIVLSKKKNDADWLDSGIPLREFKPRAVLRPLKQLSSPRQSCSSSRRALIHICFNVSAFRAKLLGNARERNPAKPLEEKLPATDRCIET